MHLEFQVKPINDKKDTYWTSTSMPPALKSTEKQKKYPAQNNNSEPGSNKTFRPDYSAFEGVTEMNFLFILSWKTTFPSAVANKLSSPAL